MLVILKCAADGGNVGANDWDAFEIVVNDVFVDNRPIIVLILSIMQSSAKLLDYTVNCWHAYAADNVNSPFAPDLTRHDSITALDPFPRDRQVDRRLQNAPDIRNFFDDCKPMNRNHDRLRCRVVDVGRRTNRNAARLPVTLRYNRMVYWYKY